MDYSIAISSLALIFSISSFYWVYLKGPKIICSKIRNITIGQSSPDAAIGLWLTFSNIGTGTGVIDSFFILVIDVSCNSATIFSAYNEGFDSLQLDPVPAPKSPVLSFAIKPGESVQKKILFAGEDFKFRENNKYTILLYIQMANKKNAMQCTKQELTIVNRIEIGRTHTAVVPFATDEPIEIPATGKGKFNYWEII